MDADGASSGVDAGLSSLLEVHRSTAATAPRAASPALATTCHHSFCNLHMDNKRCHSVLSSLVNILLNVDLSCHADTFMLACKVSVVL